MAAVLAISFINPFLLWGAGLASVPLIIHILNRHRYKTVHWAAMEFLLRAFKENRRKIRFQNLLLLLLRMAIVALLAFLLSRPNASSDDIGGVFGQRVLHQIVILDDSASMGERIGVSNNFDQAKQQILKIVNGLSDRGSSDLFTLIRSSSDKPDFHGRQITKTLAIELADLLKGSRPTPARFELADVINKAKVANDDLSGNEAKAVDAVNLYLISDLRKVDFIAEEGKINDEASKSLHKFPWKTTNLKVIQVGNSSNKNLALIKLRRKEARSVSGQPSHFEVTIQNQGGTASGEIDLSFSLDGGSKILRKIPSLGPTNTHTETFKVDLEKPGDHWVEASLPNDLLGFDNNKVLAFPVARSSAVLVVDGDPGEREVLAESFYLISALDPVGDGSEGYDVSVIDEHQIADKDFADFDLVILANVAQLDRENTQRLEKYVKEGGGLLLLSGDQVEPATWNRIFWKQGNGLLPAPLKDIGGDFDKSEALILVAEEHPIFAVAKEQLRKQLDLFVRVGRYHLVGSADAGLGEGEVPEGTTVLIRVGTDSGPPLHLEKSFGNGLVNLITTTLDASWTTWPKDPSYLIVVREMAQHLLRREDLRPLNLSAHGTYVRPLSAVEYRPDVSLAAAKEVDRDLVPERGFLAQSTNDSSGDQILRVDPPKGRPWPISGGYSLELGRMDGGKDHAYFSVSSWEREGMVLALDERGFKSSLPPDVLEKTEVITLESGSAALAGLLVDEGEVWRYLAFALLAFLLMETLFAWRIGHR